MPSPKDLIHTIHDHPDGITLAGLLALHPNIRRRTAQRWIRQAIQDKQIIATGQGRARRYLPWNPQQGANPLTEPTSAQPSAWLLSEPDPASEYPVHLPLSEDSRDILAYIDQPLSSRTPVGYQREFLDAYQPNHTEYLSRPLRRQLGKMGDTRQTHLPSGTFGKAILNRLLIDLSWASSHLEGNTYSRLDTLALIDHGTVAKGKDAMETQMILNHKAAIDLLVSHADQIDFNRYTLLNLHSALSENLLPNPADEGRVRQHLVEIGKSVYRPLSVPQQINEILDDVLTKARQIHDPFEQSFFVMVHLPYLQPFADVNKRTSRLAANLPLIRANLCPLTFLGVPSSAYSRAILGVYEMTRVELLRDLYVWAYERSTQEYLAIRSDLAEPEPLRLIWRNVIKKTIHLVITQPDQDPVALIRQSIKAVSDTDRTHVEALIIEELRRLHEGVLARYGLRPEDLSAWRSHPKRGKR